MRQICFETFCLYITLITFCFGDKSTTNTIPVQSTAEPDVESDGPKNCGFYRSLARETNSFTTRGTVCCEDFGCFSNEKDTPWEHLTRTPQCMADIKPKFFLFTTENSTAQTFNYFTFNDTLDDINISMDRPLFIVIHGFNEPWPNVWMFPMKDELIRLGNNVLLVRWTDGSNKKNYIKAAANTRTVGTALGVVIQALVDHEKVNLSSTTIVGFGLGAHAAGYAGQNLQNLKRIIGLDPAGPLFDCEDVRARLSPMNAEFVQVIHTNGLSFFTGGLGTMESRGHVDFYVNDGLVQPGCPTTNGSAIKDIAQFDFSQVGAKESCSHERCPWIFIEMLRGMGAQGNICSFVSFPCQDFEKWHKGECFKCSSNGCPTPGYGMDFGSLYKGKFFFNTQPHNFTDGGYCGKQLLLTLVTDRDVKGLISVSFVLNSDKSDHAIFQKYGATIMSNSPKSTVIVAPWDTKVVRNIILMYSKYKSKIAQNNGPSNFTLKSITFSNPSNPGDKFTSCIAMDIESDKPTIIKFNPYC